MLALCFGFEDFKVYISTKPEDAIGSQEQWQLAEVESKSLSVRSKKEGNLGTMSLEDFTNIASHLFLHAIADAIGSGDKEEEIRKLLKNHP